MIKTLTKFVLVTGLSAPFCLSAQQTDKKDSVKVLNEVIVNDQKAASGTLKLNVPLKDMPVTLNSVSRVTLNAQGSDDFQSALRNVSGVNPVTTYGGFQQFIIRGFTDFLFIVDGFRDERQNISASAPMSTTAAVDRIEVLKGPASVLFGHSALGGVINIIRKQPSATPAFDFSIAYGSYNSRRMTAGAGGAITDKLTYRVDFGISDEDGWRGGGFSKANAYLALRYQLSKTDQFDFQSGLNKDSYKLDAGIPSINGAIPAGVPYAARYNTPQDFMKNKRSDFQLRYSHNFSAEEKLTETISYAKDEYDYFSSEGLTVNPAQNTVDREYFNFNTHVKPLQNTLEYSNVIHTGAVEQRFTIGNSLNYLNWKRFQDGNLSVPAAIDLLNPVETQHDIQIVNNRRRILKELSTSFYLQDWMKFSEQLKGLIGLRYDYFKGTYRNDNLNTGNAYVEGTATDRTSNAFTWRFGLVYEPLTVLSVYGSYSNYFKPSRAVPTNDIVLKPEKGFQYELGAKLNLSNTLSSTTSVYYIDKSDIVLAKGAGVLEQAGKALSRGIEQDLTYAPDVHWTVIAGYSYNRARFKDYQIAGNINLKGNRLYYAPDHQANLWATYNFAKHISDNGLSLSVGGNVMGDSYADNENTVKMPSYYIINAAAHYKFKFVELGLNVNNVLNKENYIVSAINSTQLYPGKPANYLLSLRYKL